MRDSLKTLAVLSMALWACGPAEPEATESPELASTEQAVVRCDANFCTASRPCETICEPDGMTCGDFGICDVDNDDDYIANTNDNCPNHYNPNQEDCDADGIGDPCDYAKHRYVEVRRFMCSLDVDFHVGYNSWEYGVSTYYVDQSTCGAPRIVRTDYAAIERYCTYNDCHNDCQGVTNYWSAYMEIAPDVYACQESNACPADGSTW